MVKNVAFQGERKILIAWTSPNKTEVQHVCTLKKGEFTSFQHKTFYSSLSLTFPFSLSLCDTVSQSPSPASKPRHLLTGTSHPSFTETLNICSDEGLWGSAINQIFEVSIVIYVSTISGFSNLELCIWWFLLITRLQLRQPHFVSVFYRYSLITDWQRESIGNVQSLESIGLYATVSEEGRIKEDGTDTDGKRKKWW